MRIQKRIEKRKFWRISVLNPFYRFFKIICARQVPENFDTFRALVINLIILGIMRFNNQKFNLTYSCRSPFLRYKYETVFKLNEILEKK